ncbi:AAA family ATPase [Micrococcus luteus]|uniref:AAA family ATPase n=1 Tax=Micrococcus luteus TaxID=1270 RepID=UPI001C234A5A|nr:AAA family ATPase [Micrococcus luteus]MBU8793213.1 AAA family ATPase [Micrococcus luteus]
MTAATIKFATHKRLADPFGPLEMTSEEFLQWLDLDAPSVVPDDAKKTVPSYLLATLTGTDPETAQVRYRYGAALDVDKWTPEDVQVLRGRVRGLGAWAVIHSTHSSSAEVASCRVIVLYCRPVTPDEHARISDALMAQLGEGLPAFDKASRVPRQEMFRPSAHPDRVQDYWHEVVEGELLDVEVWLSRAPAEAATASAAEAVEAVQDPDRADRVVELILSKDLPELAALPEGGRTDDGHGWDSGVYKLATRLIRAHNSGARGTLEELEAAFFEAAPPADGSYNPRHKWDNAVEAVGDEGLTELERDPRSTAAQDFAAMPGQGPDGDLRPGVQRELQRLRDRAEAQRLFAEESGATPGVDWRERLTGGGGFVFDIPTDLPSVWGEGTRSLWARGEALMLVGPSGVGKSTLAGQLVRAMVLGGGTVLGLPVRGMGKVLYLAMDRPAQLRRSLHRQFTEDERATLEQKLVVWAGPPPADLASDPGLLLEMCRAAGADVVVVDSLKDAALGLSEDTVGAAYNSARQAALAGGVEVLELHHQVKRGANGGAPTTLADVYGSGWITAGAGSVVLLHGEAGAASVELRHLKQPAEPVGPLTIEHDPAAGVSRVGEAVPRAALAEQKHRELMSQVHEYLTRAEAEGVPPMSKTRIQAGVTGKNERVGTALDALVQEGYVKREWAERYDVHSVARPFDLL